MALQIDATKFRAALGRLSSLPADARRRIFGTWASFMEGRLNQRAPRGLSGSFKANYTAEKAVIGSRKPWARITHFGGTIYASGDPHYRTPEPPLVSRKGTASEVTGKPIRYLAIPIGARKNTRPRDYKNTFVFKSKKGNLLVAQRKGGKAKKGKTGLMKLLFLLRKFVKISKKPYADIQKEEAGRLGEIIVSEMSGLLTKK